MLSLIILIIILIVGYLVTTKNNFIMSFFNKKKVEGKVEEKYNNEDIVNTDDIEGFFETEYQSNDRFVYLDLETNKKNLGKVIIELKSDIVPKTAKNFRELCKQKKYVNTRFHRIIDNFMVQGGDITNNNGTGGYSIYGEKFDDENFELKHVKGVLSMANSGPNTNGSQFFITVEDTEWLNGKHTVFGEVIKGMDLIEYISKVKVNDNSEPLQDIIISDCGIYSPK